MMNKVYTRVYIICIYNVLIFCRPIIIINYKVHTGIHDRTPRKSACVKLFLNNSKLNNDVDIEMLKGLKWLLPINSVGYKHIHNTCSY